MNKFLLVEVYQGDENSPDVRTFRIGPFAPEPESATVPVLVQEKRYTAVEMFKSELNRAVEALNRKYFAAANMDENRLEYEVAECTLSDGATGIPPETAILAIAKKVEEWMKGRLPRVA